MGGSANGTPRNCATPGAVASSINPLTVPTVVFIERLDEVTFVLARESHIGKRRSLKNMIMRVNYDIMRCARCLKMVRRC